MKKFNPKQFKARGPERKIQDDIIKMLRHKGWYVKETHGNMYQSGFPDLYATHPIYKARWIEVKDPNRRGDVFTAAQLRDFPLFCAHGAGVWVLTGATETEYEKLGQPYNWFTYLQIMR